MYEPEVNSSVESIEALPEEIRGRFMELGDRIESRTMLPWGEHCTECVWPTCYTTCELYTPRPDGGCRLFVEGMVRIDHKNGLSPYLLKVRFKQWAKLWTRGTLRLEPLAKASRQELCQIAIGALARSIPAPDSIRPRLLRKVNYLRRRSAERARLDGQLPDYFLLECYNPGAQAVALTFTVRATSSSAPPFRALISASRGYSRATVAASEIFASIDASQPFEVEIVPNHAGDTVLYFGLMDFVKERVHVKELAGSTRDGRSGTGAATIKCLVWDLDNTLWDGILVEDGPEKIRIRERVVDVIRRADERGILNSIASKNNYDDGMQVLRAFGIDEYFLYPQIKWQPKSRSLAHIAHLLNIGVDTLALIDDQVFEREEVKATLPQVTVIDAAAYGEIPARPEWRAAVTDESRSRRAMYREQEQRETALLSHQGDYLAFLKDCRMEITLRPLDESNLQRVYELAQRTNQLNFSGNRYQMSELREIAGRAYQETYVISCADRFGDYGIVGFAVVETSAPRLLDLMFSCRVQGKRVEHAFLAFLLNRFLRRPGEDFHAAYRRTTKNAPAGKVFEEMGFESATDGDPSSLVFHYGRAIPDDGIIELHTLMSTEAAAS
jgi:HAD-superfamily phosphatase, subfamily IIIC/FkbH-like domain